MSWRSFHKQSGTEERDQHLSFERVRPILQGIAQAVSNGRRRCGSVLFPEPTQVLVDLVTMLRIDASAERVPVAMKKSCP